MATGCELMSITLLMLICRFTYPGRTTLTFQFNVVGEMCDLTAKLLGKWGSWLGIKKNKYCFIVHTICCVYWVGIDIYRNLWMQALFTLPSIALQLYGFYKWSKEDNKN